MESAELIYSRAEIKIHRMSVCLQTKNEMNFYFYWAVCQNEYSIEKKLIIRYNKQRRGFLFTFREEG